MRGFLSQHQHLDGGRRRARVRPWRAGLPIGDADEHLSRRGSASREKIHPSHLCRVLRLTLLAPKLVEAILDGRQPEKVTLPTLMKGFPVEWDGQHSSSTPDPSAPAAP